MYNFPQLCAICTHILADINSENLKNLYSYSVRHEANSDTYSLIDIKDKENKVPNFVDAPRDASWFEDVHLKVKSVDDINRMFFGPVAYQIPAPAFAFTLQIALMMVALPQASMIQLRKYQMPFTISSSKRAGYVKNSNGRRVYTDLGWLTPAMTRQEYRAGSSLSAHDFGLAIDVPQTVADPSMRFASNLSLVKEAGLSIFQRRSLEVYDWCRMACLIIRYPTVSHNDIIDMYRQADFDTSYIHPIVENHWIHVELGIPYSRTIKKAMNDNKSIFGIPLGVMWTGPARRPSEKDSIHGQQYIQLLKQMGTI